MVQHRAAEATDHPVEGLEGRLGKKALFGQVVLWSLFYVHAYAYLTRWIPGSASTATSPVTLQAPVRSRAAREEEEATRQAAAVAREVVPSIAAGAEATLAGRR